MSSLAKMSGGALLLRAHLPRFAMMGGEPIEMAMTPSCGQANNPGLMEWWECSMAPTPVELSIC